MGIVKNVVRALAVRVHNQVNFMGTHPHKFQQSIFKSLVNHGKQTTFGKDHDMKHIKNYEDYKKALPIQNYETLQPYLDQIIEGKASVLWPGRPKYLVESRHGQMTPISKASLPHHFNTVKFAIFNYVMKYGILDTFDGKFLFITDTFQDRKLGKHTVSSLSKVLGKDIPVWLKFNKLPKPETNDLPDWNEKVERLVDETIHENITMLYGLPALTLSYLEKLQEKIGNASIKEVFPNLKLNVYGGMESDQYTKRINELIGNRIDKLEIYVMSEGFIAFQDSKEESGMMLNVNGGIFYEFIPVAEYRDDHPTRYQLSEVQKGEEYVMVISTNAGIFCLDTEDVVEFTSLDPFRITVKGKVDKILSKEPEEKDFEVFDLQEDDSDVTVIH